MKAHGTAMASRFKLAAFVNVRGGQNGAPSKQASNQDMSQFCMRYGADRQASGRLGWSLDRPVLAVSGKF